MFFIIIIISVYYGFIKYPHNYALIHKGKMWLGHNLSSQKHIVWIKIIDFSFKPKIIRILSNDHVH